jgi:phosphoserine phosphatase RsbU/P
MTPATGVAAAGRPRLLVVDDEPGMLRTVERVLAPAYDVHAARLPSLGLEAAAAAPFDLAILDVRMPEMDGFELMAKLLERHPGMDVILMTGSTDERDARLVRAIRQKAFFFLTKPFDRDVLLTLVERCLDLRRLDAEHRAQLDRLAQELEAARAFQRRMLPRLTAEGEGARIAIHYEPSAELCGDFCDYAFGDGGVAALVIDVAGHGARAAMLTGMVKLAFHAAAAEAYEPAAVLRQIVDSSRLFPRGLHLTGFALRARPVAGTLEYVNAGHPPALLKRADGTVARLGATTTVVHPALPNVGGRAESVPFVPGDRLLVYSDGLTEARDANEDEYGIDRAARCVASSAGALLAAVRADVAAFAAGRPLGDDLVLFELEATPR